MFTAFRKKTYLPLSPDKENTLFISQGCLYLKTFLDEKRRLNEDEWPHYFTELFQSMRSVDNRIRKEVLELLFNPIASSEEFRVEIMRVKERIFSLLFLFEDRDPVIREMITGIYAHLVVHHRDNDYYITNLVRAMPTLFKCIKDDHVDVRHNASIILRVLSQVGAYQREIGRNPSLISSLILTILKESELEIRRNIAKMLDFFSESDDNYVLLNHPSIKRKLQTISKHEYDLKIRTIILSILKKLNDNESHLIPLSSDVSPKRYSF